MYVKRINHPEHLEKLATLVTRFRHFIDKIKARWLIFSKIPTMHYFGQFCTVIFGNFNLGLKSGLLPEAVMILTFPDRTTNL